MQRPFPAYEGDEPFLFVCYSHDDAEMVYPEITRLNDSGFNVWYDEGISPGSEWSDAIARHIKHCKTLLYFVTPNSVRSEHCRREVNFALEQSCGVLAVHLEPTELPDGLQLSLSNRQGILRYEHPQARYEKKLIEALQEDQLGRSGAPSGGLRIGDWTLHVDGRRLSRRRTVRVLEPKQLSVLLHLADRAPERVSAADLIGRSWPDERADEAVLSDVITRLRDAFGERAEKPRYVETLPDGGYRMIAQVQPLPRVRKSPVRWRAFAAAALMIAAVGTAGWFFTMKSRQSDDAFVLEIQPFANESDTPELAHAAAGLHDELVHRLSQIPAISVTRSKQVGRFVLNGSLRSGGEDGVRIATTLDDDSQRTIWSQNFDVPADVALARQVEVAIQITQVLNALARSGVFQLRDALPNANARLAFIRGISKMQTRETEDVQEALSYFVQAAAIEPDFAPTLALEGLLYQRLVSNGAMEIREGNDRARALRDRALALNQNIPVTWLLDANIKFGDADFVGADASMERALVGGDPMMSMAAATQFAYCGHLDKAFDLIDRAILADPINVDLQRTKGALLWFDRRFNEALALSDELLADTPHYADARLGRVLSLASLQRWEEAIEALGLPLTDEMRANIRADGQGSWGKVWITLAQRIERGEIPGPPNVRWRYYFAGYAALGQYDEALRWVKQGWQVDDRYEVLAERYYQFPGFAEFWRQPATKAYMESIIGNPPTCPGPA